MAERLKDLFFSEKFIAELGQAIKEVFPGFKQAEFNGLIFTEDWEGKELKQRMHHITQALVATLPRDYSQALKILTEVAPRFEGFNSMIFPDFVEKRGLDDWDLSLPALAVFTRLCSSEFAIRPFLAKDPERAMPYMYRWAEDEDYHLRRLSSEGCRPRLPWAMALPGYKKDPSPLIPLLEILKDDPVEYVRKSVANNLNDISKDHPDLVLDICERWYGHSEHTNWIVKRACRTLLKDGSSRALILFGFSDPVQIVVEGFGFNRQILAIGSELQFSFSIRLTGKEVRRVRLEYAVDYIKAKGKISRKIFQIKETDLGAGSYVINKKHSFKNLSTRKHYPGQHQFTIIINGVEKATGAVRVE